MGSLQLPLSALFSRYTHLLFAHGASRSISLPDMDPDLTVPALNVVHWYTGHPFSSAASPSANISLSNHRPKHITLIGHGNVSLDIARLFLSSPSALSKLEIPADALQSLIRLGETVDHINIVSRRGPREAAFTTKELRELMNLEGVAMRPIAPELFEFGEGVKLSRQQGRIVDLLKKGSKTPYDPNTKQKTWSLGFFRTPSSSRSVEGAESGRKGKIVFDMTILDSQGRAVKAGRQETQETDLVIPSMGYRSEGFASSLVKAPGTDVEVSDDVEGWYDPILGRLRTSSATPFSVSATPTGDTQSDESVLSPNRGKVYDSQSRLVSSVYASGWAGTNGAKGVLASTMYDAYDVGDTIVADYLSSVRPSSDSLLSSPLPRALESAVYPMVSTDETVRDDQSQEGESGVPVWLLDLAQKNSKRIVTWRDWKNIDAVEAKLGEKVGKERERLTTWSDVMASGALN